MPLKDPAVVQHSEQAMDAALRVDTSNSSLAWRARTTSTMRDNPNDQVDRPCCGSMVRSVTRNEEASCKQWHKTFWSMGCVVCDKMSRTNAEKSVAGAWTICASEAYFVFEIGRAHV